jgi:hypothetical protein
MTRRSLRKGGKPAAKRAHKPKNRAAAGQTQSRSIPPPAAIRHTTQYNRQNAASADGNTIAARSKTRRAAPGPNTLRVSRSVPRSSSSSPQRHADHLFFMYRNIRIYDFFPEILPGLPVPEVKFSPSGRIFLGFRVLHKFPPGSLTSG